MSLPDGIGIALDVEPGKDITLRTYGGKAPLAVQSTRHMMKRTRKPFHYQQLGSSKDSPWSFDEGKTPGFCGLGRSMAMFLQSRLSCRTARVHCKLIDRHSLGSMRRDLLGRLAEWGPPPSSLIGWQGC